MSQHFPAVSGYKLFEGNLKTSITINDTTQSGTQDCWVLSTLASVAEVSERIWRMFDIKTYNAKGIYSIRLYELGVPISVVIDDYLPISDLIATVDVNSKETWPLLIQKAFSKLNGNYKSTATGWPIDAGAIFLGTGGSSIGMSSVTVDQLWNTAVDWDSRGYIITALT